MPAACPTAVEVPRKSRTATPPDWRLIAQALTLALATVVCYLPSLGGGFLWDDREVLLDGPLMKSAAGLWRIWFSTVPPDYYPVDYTSLWLEWHLWGADPLGYRLVNLAWHIGSAFLFWRLLAFWRLRWAWFAALLFALHPLNVASVAWIVERKNVLSMFFYLATLLCWVHAREEGSPARRRRTLYLAALLAFALALGSKSSVVMLPGVLLLVVWWRSGKINRRDLWQSAPFFGLSLLAGIVSLRFQNRAMSPASGAAAFPPLERAALAGKSIWFYLGKAWFPHPLVMIYPRWRLWPLHGMDFVPLALLVLVCAASGWLAIRRGWRGPAAALAYFCLNLLPVAGLFPMAFYSLSFVSDHLVYVSLLGVCALCAEGLAGAGERPGLRAVSHVAAILILGACAVLTWQRAGDFGSAERLWRNTVALNPGSPEAQNNYGLALKRDGRPRAAEACFRAALHLQPAMPAALTNLAAVLVQERRWPEAAQAYRRLLAIDAGPKSYNNYGVALLYQGDPATAAAQFKEALLLDPTLSSARYNLSKIAPAPGNGAPAGRN